MAPPRHFCRGQVSPPRNLELMPNDSAKRRCRSRQSGSTTRFVALDPRDVAAGLSVANVDVPDAWNREALLDRDLNLIGPGPFAAQDPAIVTKRFQCERQLPQLSGKR